MLRGTLRVAAVAASLVLLVAVGQRSVPQAAAATPPFPFLATGFTQSLFGVTPGFMGGVAFAPNGDVWVDGCGGGGGSLSRFDSHSTIVVNGTTVHPESTASSGAGCGLTNAPDGYLYSNTTAGVVRLDASTGAQIGAAIGPSGNALGITPDPLTGNLVYVASTCDLPGTCIISINPTNGVYSDFGVLSDYAFVDGLYFSPDGSRLFLSHRAPGYSVTALNRNGTINQVVPLTSEPDGIAFHRSGLVITNNTDGTMSSVDLAATPPTVAQFASGGFRGDLTQVGPDACLYITQSGTRYADGTTTGENSIVQLCPNFAPPLGVSRITLSPLSATHYLGELATLTVAVADASSSPLSNVVVSISVTGANSASGLVTTGANGSVSFHYGGQNTGLDTISASATVDGVPVVSNEAFVTWKMNPCHSVSVDRSNSNNVITGEVIGHGCSNLTLNVSNRTFLWAEITTNASGGVTLNPSGGKFNALAQLGLIPPTDFLTLAPGTISWSASFDRPGAFASFFLDTTTTKAREAGIFFTILDALPLPIPLSDVILDSSTLANDFPQLHHLAKAAQIITTCVQQNQGQLFGDIRTMWCEQQNGAPNEIQLSLTDPAERAVWKDITSSLGETVATQTLDHLAKKATFFVTSILKAEATAVSKFLQAPAGGVQFNAN
jgi:hypothetical protein